MNILQQTYLDLIRIGLDDIDFAIKTDYMKARLRDEIVKQSGIDTQLIQDWYENKARKEGDYTRSKTKR